MKRTKTIGRKLGKMHYIHKSAISYLPVNEKNTLQIALSLVNDSLVWNLAKISVLGDTVSLLYYKEFENQIFPILTSSVIVKIKENSIKYIDYSKRDNPPVLHRKELFLAPDDLRIEQFAKITAFCEKEGLFDNASYIGTIKKWEKRLADNNYKVEGQIIVKI